MLAAAFCGSACLFLLELFAGKFLLPRFGGAPAVWVSCLAFFQAALVGGYLFSHRVSRAANPRVQVGLMAGLFLLSALMTAVLFGGPDMMAAGVGLPRGMAVAAALACTVGPAFFTLATLAPLLGHWHALGAGGSAQNGDAAADGAYRLYAAGNAGSFAALLAYPLLVEPFVGLSQQAGILAVLFFVVGCLSLLIGWQLAMTTSTAHPEAHDRAPGPPCWQRWLRWALLAAIPASWLGSVTTYTTVEVAPLPLLWIVPLALYLTSFVVVFSARGRPLRQYEPAASLAALIAAAWLLACNVQEPTWAVLAAHGVILFVISVALHGMLADDRPHPLHLTDFYLAMAVGGAIGGLFNALIAPLLFDAHHEFPITVAVAAGLLPPIRRAWRPVARAAVCVGAACFLAVADGIVPWLPTSRTAWMIAVFTAAVVSLVVLRGWERTCGMILLLLAAFWTSEKERGVIHRTRTFFGVIRVAETGNGPSRELLHGAIRHGVQLVSDDPARRRIPLAYYHPAGPLGSVFATLPQLGAVRRVGVAGLGIGTVAAYATSGQEFVFFEIDPAVVGVAKNAKWFTFLADSPGTMRIVVEDARLALAAEPDDSFDLLVVDAFTGDSVPTHLLTREALSLYGRKVTTAGVVAIHISNRYLDFAPLITALAADGGWMALDGVDRDVPEDFARLSSRWMVLSRSLATIEAIYDNPTSDRWRWEPAVRGGNGRTWTDDRTSVTEVLSLP